MAQNCSSREAVDNFGSVVLDICFRGQKIWSHFASYSFACSLGHLLICTLIRAFQINTEFRNHLVFIYFLNVSSYPYDIFMSVNILQTVQQVT